jgi:predicted TIM-barrel fold metal-dependent hydrolase
VACLYGNIRETIDAGLGAVAGEVRRKILWENAAALYRIDARSEELSPA